MTTQEITVSVAGREKRRFPKGISGLDVVRALGMRIPEDLVTWKVNGRLKDIRTALETDCEVELLPFASDEGQEVYRHSSTHLMAQAVKRLFPGARLAIGPAIEDGFYYDFEYSRPFTPEDLQQVEETMAELIRADLPIIRREIPKQEAIDFFRRRGEPYKVEILEELADETVSLYEQGDFVDLCEGPHLPSTGQIRAFKLLNTAGAYWRGDEHNAMLQRIYGTSFPSREALQDYLRRLEEIKKRDHRRLGRELDLFSIQDEIGPGLVLWLPKGAKVRRILEDYWRDEHDRRGYDLVFTPHLARIDLWRRSGHLEFYRENMFSPIAVEQAAYQLKPMNCPFHITIYKMHRRSYRELPIRLAELGTVYRYERSGVLHGLMRVRGFTQDDAHIFCTPDQLESEITGVLDFTVDLTKAFGFEAYETYLSTKPERAVGSDLAWQQATAALESALQKKGLPYRVDPGEGVFYGPKIDIKIKDALDRAWQCATIQVDFNLPDRFGLTYIGEDGQAHQPIMVHRALMGSLERFVGILIEHYGGAFPTWLAPVQVSVIPITQRHHDYGRKIHRQLKENGIRVELDDRNEKMGLKIREAQLKKIPYMLIVGDQEIQAGTVSVRSRRQGDLGAHTPERFLELLRTEVSRRLVEPPERVNREQ